MFIAETVAGSPWYLDISITFAYWRSGQYGRRTWICLLFLVTAYVKIPISLLRIDLKAHLEMHSKRRCKIWICSVILGELGSFLNYMGFSIISPKILGHENYRFMKVRIFLISLSIKYFNPSILRFPFLRKIA